MNIGLGNRIIWHYMVAFTELYSLHEGNSKPWIPYHILFGWVISYIKITEKLCKPHGNMDTGAPMPASLSSTRMKATSFF